MNINKMIALALVLALAIALTGCGKEMSVDKNYGRNIAVGAVTAGLGAYVVYDLVKKNMPTETTTTTTTTTTDTTTTTTGTTTTTAGSSAWATKAALPTGRSYLGAAVVNGKIYAIGGQSGLTSGTTTLYDEILEYDPGPDIWTLKKNKGAKNFGLGAGTVNNKIYIIGGYDGTTYYDTVEEYDPAADTITTQNPKPSTGAYFGLAVEGATLFCLGGKNAAPSNAVEFFEPNTWESTLTNLPSQLDNFACVTVSNEIFVIGGFDGSATRLSTVRAFDLDAGTWSTKAAISAPRSGMAAVVDNGKIYIFGGHDDNGSTVKTVQIYDPATNSWSAGPDMPTARQGAAAAVVGSQIYVIGGDQGLGTGNVGLTIVEAYTP